MVKTPSNFNIKCRSCLAVDQEMHDLFGVFDQGLSLSDILKSTTLFEIEENDGLSPYLCENCAKILVDFFNFKAIYLENENYIKSYLSNYKSLDENEDNDLDAQDYVESNNIIASFENEVKNNQLVMNSDETQYDEELQIKREIVEPESITEDEMENKVSENVELLKSLKYSCGKCPDIFLLKFSFRRHMLEEHNICVRDFDKYIIETTTKVPKMLELEIENEDIVLQCDICNENFKTYAEIEKHCKSHKKYVCEQCGAGFMKKTYLNDHAEVHSIEKRHVCPICGKAFKRRTVLVKHKKIHTHPRQFVCEICGLRFTDRGTLQTHIKLKHIKERNFNCTICGLWFPLKSTLMKHIYRHNEDRQREYICEICHMAYRDKSSLNRHVTIKHTEHASKPSCTSCGKEYTTNTNLLKHIRRHHQSQHINKDFDYITDETSTC